MLRKLLIFYLRVIDHRFSLHRISAVKMKRFCEMIALCALALLANASVPGQSNNPSNPSTADAGITPTSVLGVVTDIKLDIRQVTIKTNAGNYVAVTLNERTEFMRIPPGEKTKDKFIKITVADFSVGDSVYARGKISEDRKSMPALEFYVMSKTDIATKQEREREEWHKRGIVGVVTALNPETKEITLISRSPEGPKPIIIVSKEDTKFRRYAPDSVKFSDAKTSSLSELKVGDQLRALGNKNADGTHFTPEEIVSGSFQTIAGTITAVNSENSEIKINDIQNRQQLTIVISKDSLLRQLTPELTTILGAPKPGASTTGGAPSSNTPSQSGAGARPKGGGDLQEMFDQLPVLTIKELKVGETILISSTKGTDPMRVTAIALVSGVGPLLQSGQSGRPNAVRLGALDMGGIGAP